jgi:large subunit ribosomal protein L10
MPNLVNQWVVREMTEDWKDAEAMVVVSFGGLDIPESEHVRGEVAGKGAQLKMVRNRLARKVLAERGIEFAEGTLKGNTAIAFGDAEQVIGAAKVFSDKEIKKAKKITFKAGFMQGEVLDAKDAAALADLPDRDTVNAMLLGVISAPARGIASLLNAVPSSVARVLQARVDSGDAAEGGGAE